MVNTTIHAHHYHPWPHMKSQRSNRKQIESANTSHAYKLHKPNSNANGTHLLYKQQQQIWPPQNASGHKCKMQGSVRQTAQIRQH